MDKWGVLIAIMSTPDNAAMSSLVNALVITIFNMAIFVVLFFSLLRPYLRRKPSSSGICPE